MWGAGEKEDLWGKGGVGADPLLEKPTWEWERRREKLKDKARLGRGTRGVVKEKIMSERCIVVEDKENMGLLAEKIRRPVKKIIGYKKKDRTQGKGEI